MIKQLERIIPPVIFLILIGTVGYFAVTAMAGSGESTPTPIAGVTETVTPVEELTATPTNEPVTPTDEPTATPTDESTDETDEGLTDETTNEADESQADESTDETTEDQTNEADENQTDESTDETDEDQTDETTNEADENQTDEADESQTDETDEDKTDETTNEADESQTDESTDETDDTPPPPTRRATLVAVQSDRQSHTLDMIGFDGLPIRNGLHLHAGAPAWSPDGRQVAFFGEPGIDQLGGLYAAGTGIWVVDNQGGNPQRILAIDHVKNMTWSPDGTKLAFEINPPNIDNPEIRVIDPRDGSEVSRFAGEHPTWSPNSQLLAIRGCIPGCGIWQVNFDGTPVQQLTTDGSDSYPTWSPWGNYLAFARRVDNNWEIYRFSFADGHLLRLTNRPATDTTPVFGPNGQEIYFLTDENTAWRIKAVRVDGSSERQVREGVGSSDEWGLARPAVR